MRQWIESVNDTLKGQLDLEQHGGPTDVGVYAPVAQRLLALAAAIWHNWATGAPIKRSLIAYELTIGITRLASASGVVMDRVLRGGPGGLRQTTILICMLVWGGRKARAGLDGSAWLITQRCRFVHPATA
jgi:hypothetical protein